MTTILLVRHGETDWNAEQRWQGQADTPLNGRGRQQARQLARRLAAIAFEAVYSSDLRRARETAEIVAFSRGMSVYTEPALREIDVGSWAGLTAAQVAERFPDGEQPGAETLAAFRGRVLGALTAIAGRHDGATVLVVAHGGCVRTIQRHVLGEPLPTLDNCGVYAVGFQDGALRPID